MEPNFSESNEPKFTQESNEFIRKNDRLDTNSPIPQTELYEFGESNQILQNNPDNIFISDNFQKKSIDDGVTMIVEYILQEKTCPNIMAYQEKLMAYLKEKIENQVKFWFPN